jgi:hypothetical protein
MKREPLSPEEAAARNLRPLAGPYGKSERWMLDAVLSDLRRGNIFCAVVETAAGLEVWRTNHGWIAEE